MPFIVVSQPAPECEVVGALNDTDGVYLEAAKGFDC